LRVSVCDGVRLRAGRIAILAAQALNLCVLFTLDGQYQS